MLSGGLIGFLFGLPRFKFDSTAVAAAGATAAATTAAATGDAPRYRPSTNLDDVADWLTKIIVGVTLVQLKDKDPAALSEARAPISGERDDEVDDDPNKATFGNRPLANDRVLRAIIEPSTTRPGWCRITLAVTSTHPAKPLIGSVIFHLHPTFDKPVVTVPVENGVATLTIVAYGAFTVGAEADSGKTRLGLDPARNPDAPEDFKAR